MNKTILKLAATAMLASIAAAAGAQESTDAWPNRPITLVVTYAAGGPVVGVIPHIGRRQIRRILKAGVN